MTWATRRVADSVRRTIRRHGLLEDGEPVLIGVSGGADSLCLLRVLHELNRRRRKEWQLHAVHVDPGFAGWNSARVVAACARLGLACTVRRLSMPVGQPEPGLSACYRCARERRKELFRAAEELGCRKVALAHHMDDVNETFLLNLLYTSSAAAILPKQPLFRGRLLIVRPLYDVDKPLVRRYLGRAGVRPVRNRCPHERASSRMRLRRILERLYRESPRARANLFWGLHNLKPEYLPQQSRVRQILPTK